MDDELARLAAAVPAHVRTICETLTAAGHEAVAVGGAVRDALLGRTAGDWDVATSADPQTVMRLFRHTVPTGLQHGTVTIVTGRAPADNVEVTTYRGEGGYSDGRRPDHVRFGVPLVEDLARRDLRVNAIAYDPARGAIIDPYDGRRDLAERVLRAVGPTGNVYYDAVARFTEDGLRVMRAVRFAAQLEFALDGDTERGIALALTSLAKVSKERISGELRKILATRQPSLALRPAWRSGIIKLITPELHGRLEHPPAWLANLPPDDDDVAPSPIVPWLTAIDDAPPPTRLAVLCAPLAEPAPASQPTDWQRTGAKRIQDLLRALKFANDEIARAAASGAAAGAANRSEWTPPEVRRVLATVTRPFVGDAAAVWRSYRAHTLADLADAIIVRNDPLAVGELVVTGADLMAERGMQPGPAIGKALAALLEQVLDDPARNTRAYLLSATP